MRVVLVAAAVVLLMQVASAGSQFIDPEQYTLNCRLCDGQADAPTPAPAGDKQPGGREWALWGVLIGGALTFLIQRQLKLWEMRLKLLREAMAIGDRLAHLALDFSTASVRLVQIEQEHPSIPSKEVLDTLDQMVEPWALETAERREAMNKARIALPLAIYEAGNLHVPMSVLFWKSSQRRYGVAINRLWIEHHLFQPTRLRQCVREFYADWEQFVRITTWSCGMRYRGTEIAAPSLTPEQRKFLADLLRKADGPDRKEDKK